MKEIWRKVNIKNFEHYRISNYGLLINTKTNNIIGGHKIHNGKLQYELRGNSKELKIMAHLLVLKHFKINEVNKTCGIHLDYNYDNNKVSNLEWATLGDAISHTKRKNEILNNRKRGVYSFPIGNKNYRAVLPVGKMVPITLGYFKTKKEAEDVYYTAYSLYYGEAPYAR